jgi:hypothetical protein
MSAGIARKNYRDRRQLLLCKFRVRPAIDMRAPTGAQSACVAEARTAQRPSLGGTLAAISEVPTDRSDS